MPIFVIAWWHHDRRCNLTWVCIRVWAGNTYNTLDPWIRDTLSTWPNPNFLWFKMTSIANLHFSGGSQGCLYQRGSTVRPRVGAIPRLIDSERCNYWTMQALPVDKVWHCHRFDQWGSVVPANSVNGVCQACLFALSRLFATLLLFTAATLQPQQWSSSYAKTCRPVWDTCSTDGLFHTILCHLEIV